MLSTYMAFWYTETKHVICFVILCLIRCPFHMHWYVHLVLIPSFLSASKQKQQKHKIHLPCSNWSEYSPNGSNVKIPLYCSIFGRDKRRLITGRPCRSFSSALCRFRGETQVSEARLGGQVRHGGMLLYVLHTSDVRKREISPLKSRRQNKQVLHFHDKWMVINANDLQMSYVFGPKLVSQQPFHQNVGGGRQQDMICGGSRAHKNSI